MTKPAAGPLVLLVAALLFAATPVSAHGATPSREIDTRILLDDDGNLGFGGCTHTPTEECIPGMGNDALDLLNLDVREAFLGGAPAIQFRIVSQAAANHADRTMHLTFTAAGKAQSFDIGSKDGLTWGESLEHPFDRLDGPTPVGDGHPFALDGWVLESRLGVQPGDQLTAIQVETFVGTTAGDVMPGQWYANGQLVPYVPDDPSEAPDAATAPELGTYTVAGPANLLRLSLAPPSADLGAGPATLAITLTNPLNATSQFVSLNLTSPSGIAASLDAAGLNLLPGATRTANLMVVRAAQDGIVTLTVTSDLGAYQTLAVQVKPAPLASGSASGSRSGNAGASPAAGSSRGLPGTDALPLTALLLALALRRRLP